MSNDTLKNEMPPWFRPVSIIVPYLLCFIFIFAVESNTTPAQESTSPISSTEEIPEPDDISSEFATTLSEKELAEIDGKFYYQQLSLNEQEIYIALYEAVSNDTGELSFTENMSSVTSDTMNNISYALYLDNPQFFWLTGNGINWTLESFDGIRYVQKYQYNTMFTEDEIASAQTEIDLVCAQILAETQTMQTDVEKALYIYDYIITHCEYDYDTYLRSDSLEKGTDQYFSSCMAGVFVRETAVCAGYAKAYAYLLNACGIEAIYVTGNALESGESHAWNLICLNGQYCYIDATWGDPLLETPTPDYISYTYFGLTTEQLSVTHETDSAYDYPLCDSIMYNHSVLNGYYFDSYDFEALSSYVTETLSSDTSEITLCFSTIDVYQEAFTNLITLNAAQSTITNSQATYYAYTLNENRNTITLYYNL